MTINLAKGGGIDLDKRLTRVRVGLAWDKGYDADVSVAVLKGTERKTFVTDEWFVFYNNTTSPGGAVVHSGDSKTGAQEGDDETVTIDLGALPAETTEVAVLATIHEGDKRGHDWSRLKAVATLYDDVTGQVLARFDLGTDFAGKIGVQPVSLYRNARGNWTFKALGAGYAFGLEPFVERWQN